MANRFKPKWDSAWDSRAIIGGCIFCCAALLLSQGAQGAAISCQMAGSGDRSLALQSDWTWAASTGDLNSIPPVTCGAEVLMGAYSSRVLSQGGTVQSAQSIDNSEIMIFQTRQDLSGIDGVMRESMYTFGTGGAGADMALCNGNATNQTAYNQEAAVFSSVIGSGLSYQSVGAMTQADDTIPDSMAMQMLVSGNGRAVMRAEALSQVGLGNTSALGYDNSMREIVRADGREMNAGLRFEWTSFARMWQDEPAPPTNTTQEA